MRCFYCYGVDTIEEQLTRFCACDAPQPFIVENVPAQVCCQCGDKTHSAKTSTGLEKIIKGEAGPGRLRPVRVFDFNNLEEGGENVTYGIIYNTVFGAGMESAAATGYWQAQPLHGLVRNSGQPSMDTALFTEFKFSYPTNVPKPGTVVVTSSQPPRSTFKFSSP
jgi:hypothetical protein